MRDIERRALEAIDLNGLVDCLGELVAHQSVGGFETPAQLHVADSMRSAGMDADVWELDLEALRRDPAYCAELERESALGVTGRWGGGDGPTLVLNGHVDVVPAGDPARWSVPPWRATIADGRVYGRGTADMKGGLCCAIFAVRAVRDAGASIAGNVLIQSVVGEEDGGLGTLAAVRRGHTGDAAVVLEPTRLAVAPAQAGALNFRVTVPGRAAHGALRSEGVDPIEKFLPIYEALRELERTRNARPRHPLFVDPELPYAICVGLVSSGIWASTVPEALSFEGRMGVAIGEDPDSARGELETAIREIARADAWLGAHPPVVEWPGARFDPAAITTDHPIVETTRNAFRDASGREAAMEGMPYGADMRLLVNEGGTPAILFGPGDVRQAHAPDEFVRIDELATATRTLALTILRFCGTAA